MDIIEITPDTLDLDNLDIPDLNISEETEIPSKKSANFGSGIELLMNDKKKHETKKSSDINIDDITDLENELNDLTESTQKNDSGSKTSGSGDNIFVAQTEMVWRRPPTSGPIMMRALPARLPQIVGGRTQLRPSYGRSHLESLGSISLEPSAGIFFNNLSFSPSAQIAFAIASRP